MKTEEKPPDSKNVDSSSAPAIVTGRRASPPKPENGVRIIARPEDFNAPREDMEVIGAFNPGATEFTDDDGLKHTLLAIRVAYAPIEFCGPKKHILLPRARTLLKENAEFQIELDEATIGKNVYPEKIDKKEVFLRRSVGGEFEDVFRLRHVSCPVNKKSLDGIVFSEAEESSLLHPETSYERYGIEDLRITRIDEKYILSYTSPDMVEGVSGSLATTKDFKTIERLPHPLNGDKDCTPRPLFPGQKNNVVLPEKVRNPYVADSSGEAEEQYAMITRIDGFSKNSPPAIYLAFSPNLLQWGIYHKIIQTKNSNNSIAPGTNLVVDELCDRKIFWGFYHEVKCGEFNGLEGNVYRAGLFALDAEKPWRVLSVTPPIIEPQEHCEGLGYVPLAVYPTGLIVRDETAFVYCGEGDSWSSARNLPRKGCLNYLERFIGNPYRP